MSYGPSLIWSSIGVSSGNGFWKRFNSNSMFVDESLVEDALLCSRVDKGLSFESFGNGLVIMLGDR